MMVGFYSYIADITTEKERTVRIGIISLVYSVGIPFGMAFSGILIRYLCFFFIFVIWCPAEHIEPRTPTQTATTDPRQSLWNSHW